MASTAAANQILENVFRFGGTVYCGLSTTTSTEDGTGFTEVTATGYTRTAVPADGTGFTAAVDKFMTTVADIVFTAPSVDAGDVLAFAFFATGGGSDLITAQPTAAPITWYAGQPLTIAAGTVGLYGA